MFGMTECFCMIHMYDTFLGCRISDKGVRQLVDGPCGLKLRELNLTNCIRVGDMAMVNIHKRSVLHDKVLYIVKYSDIQ